MDRGCRLRAAHIGPGQEWAEAIIAAIDRSSVMVLIFSRDCKANIAPRARARGALLGMALANTKVRELATNGAPFVDAARLIAAVLGIRDESDPTRLMRLTVPT